MRAKGCDWRTGCDVEATLSVIGGLWKPIILSHLLNGTQRFGALSRLVPNVTQRMLTIQLRELEADGIVLRTVHAAVPPRVDYELTPLGHSLRDVLEPMCVWGRAYKLRRNAGEKAVA